MGNRDTISSAQAAKPEKPAAVAAARGPATAGGTLMFCQRIQVNFSPPADRPPPAPEVIWSEATALLALTIGIADIDGLREALLRGLADTSRHRGEGGLARTANGQYGPVIASTFVAGQRATDLIAELDQILASADWPVAGVPQAESLRTALSEYGDWLSGMRFSLNSPRPGAPKKSESLLVRALAHAWPSLTGEPPMAWKAGESRGRRSGGRFCLFVEMACAMFKLRAPSPDTVHRVLKLAERQPKAA